MLAPENCPQVPAGTRNGLLLWLARESLGEKVWCQKSLPETCWYQQSIVAGMVLETFSGASPVLAPEQRWHQNSVGHFL